jgi:indole-3-glycerol phosphate synthase
VGTILDKIVESKLRELAEAQQRIPANALAKRILDLPVPRPFEQRLREPGMQIVAEVKKASPSAGVIRADFDPVRIAKIYEEYGAACISVLTDSPFFHGALSYLESIRAEVSLPLLRKDFILDQYQLLEARAAGADAVLLIAEILAGDALQGLYRSAREIGLDVLVELHDADQLPRVLDCGATLIGINNRDLRRFETRLEHTLELMERVPKDRCLVSESGIHDRADVVKLEMAGVKAILVGETLMRAADPGALLSALLGKQPSSDRPQHCPP